MTRFQRNVAAGTRPREVPDPPRSLHTYESYRNSCARPTLSFMRRCGRLARREGLGAPPPRKVGPCEAALVEHGSQRKAALALGLNLSTFQRRLKKEQDACAA